MFFFVNSIFTAFVIEAFLMEYEGATTSSSKLEIRIKKLKLDYQNSSNSAEYFFQATTVLLGFLDRDHLLRVSMEHLNVTQLCKKK